MTYERLLASVGSADDLRFALDRGGKILKEWSWDEFNALPQTELKTDIHCVTTWSKFDMAWAGVSVDTLLGAQTGHFLALAGLGAQVVEEHPRGGK